MKFVFIILLLPSVAFGFLIGVPYKKTIECNKIRINLDNVLMTVGYLPLPPKYYNGYSKAFLEAQKHKCFKQTPACKKAVSDAQQTAYACYKLSATYTEANMKIERMNMGWYMDPSKISTEWDRYKFKEKRAKLYRVKYTAKAYMDEAKAYYSKATTEIKKYCKYVKKLDMAQKRDITRIQKGGVLYELK